MPACKGRRNFYPGWPLSVRGCRHRQKISPLPCEGYGAIVVKNTEPGAERNYFYEQYSKKSYYIMDYYEYTITEPGTWYLYYWDPYNRAAITLPSGA